MVIRPWHIDPVGQNGDVETARKMFACVHEPYSKLHAGRGRILSKGDALEIKRSKHGQRGMVWNTKGVERRLQLLKNGA